MNKKIWNEPEIEIIELITTDILTASDEYIDMDGDGENIKNDIF